MKIQLCTDAFDDSRQSHDLVRDLDWPFRREPIPGDIIKLVLDEDPVTISEVVFWPDGSVSAWLNNEMTYDDALGLGFVDRDKSDVL